MKKTIKLLLLLLSFTPILVFANTAPPALYKVKQELIQYYNSGQYSREINQVTTEAIGYLKKRITQNNQSAHPKKLAVVFDIDETSLSNYPGMRKMGFGGSLKEIEAQEAMANDKAIPGTLKLYNFAKKNNVATFFITGRTKQFRQLTVKNLKAAGYNDWNGLYLKPQSYHKGSVIPYKSSIRKKIEAKGYDIVLSIGDQWSDLKGGFADAIFKLPDPFYFIS